MGMDPKAMLIEGAQILDPIMNANGFAFKLLEEGRGSGGHFAVGEYRRGDRRLELHYRWGLGIVRYAIASSMLGHLNYMKLIGAYRESRFASTMLDGTLDGFYRLRDDLERYGSDFLCGDGKQFCLFAMAGEQNSKR